MAGGAGGGRGGTRAPLVSVSSPRRAVSSPPLPARRRRRSLPRRAPLGRAGRRWRNKAQRLRRGHQYGGHAGAPRSAAPRGAESGAGGYSATCRTAPAPQRRCRTGHAPLSLSLSAGRGLVPSGSAPSAAAGPGKESGAEGARGGSNARLSACEGSSCDKERSSRA